MLKQKLVYNGVITSVRIIRGETNTIRNIIDLHWGSALRLHPVTLVIDEFTKHIQDEVSSIICNDIVSLTRLKLG